MARETWFQHRLSTALERFQESNVRVGWFDPVMSASVVAEPTAGQIQPKVASELLTIAFTFTESEGVHTYKADVANSLDRN